ncbi:MAG TPA: DnaJ domain-containing protein [Chloroflexota bacterium]|jgi:molecular chaperone DnaJ|nr:DnaJ domain-containing protein [Chloroflexota bacterium]
MSGNAPGTRDSRHTGYSGDYYDVLGLSPGATEAEIRSAFRKLARQHHPDVNPDPAAPERFRAVVTAYEVLSDPERRREYDARRSRGAPRGATWPGGSGGTRGTRGRAYPGGWPGDTSDADPATVSPRAPVRGLDRHTTLRVAAERLAEGGDETLQHRRWERCARCTGFGRLREEVPCPVCGGSGFRGGHISDPCKACWTSGTTTVCPDCTGRGSHWQPKRLDITVPKGARYGQQLRLRGMGDAGPRGGPAGDLYVELAPPLPAAVQAVASHELIQAALKRLEEWLDRFAPYPESQ